MPRTLEPAIHARFVNEQTCTLPEYYLARIRNAELIDTQGLLVLPDGQFALEPAYGRNFLEQQTAYKSYDPGRPARRMPGKFFLLMALWANTGNYYHWLHDVLPRLHRTLEALPSDIFFVVRSGLHPFEVETLELLGIPKAQVVFYSGDETWRLEELYYSPPPCRYADSSPEATRWLRSRLLASCQVTAAARTRRIYVRRRSAAHLRLTNEPEIETLLRGYHFESYALEQMRFREQVALFAQAAIVVGPQGAGLTNIMFAPAGAILVGHPGMMVARRKGCGPDELGTIV